MTPSPRRLLNNDLTVLAMQEKRQKSSPDKENTLHNPQRERSLQHRAGLIDMQRERVIRVNAPFAKRTEGSPDRAAVPVGAVGVGDEAQLVNARHERAEEEEIDERDEEGGALGC